MIIIFYILVSYYNYFFFFIYKICFFLLFFLIYKNLGSWDQTVGIWDSRTSSSPSSPLRMSGKVYSISLTSTRLVVATSDRRIIVYDQRNLSTPEQIRESPLRYLTRHISCFPNGEGFAIGSIEVYFSFYLIFYFIIIFIIKLGTSCY